MTVVCSVQCRMYSPAGEPKKGVQITARLNRPSVTTSTGLILRKVQQVETDADGFAVLHLWPNELGIDPSAYLVSIYDPKIGRSAKGTALVPNLASADLHEILCLGTSGVTFSSCSHSSSS